MDTTIPYLELYQRDQAACKATKPLTENSGRPVTLFLVMTTDSRQRSAE